MSTQLSIGIDPGASGAVAVLDKASSPIAFLRFSKATPLEAVEFLEQFRGFDVRVSIERVQGIPGESSKWSMEKLMKQAGMMIGIVTAQRFRFKEVPPATWQTKLNCKTGGNKAISRAAAQQRWPHLKVTNETADAFLIAEFGRLTWE